MVERGSNHGESLTDNNNQKMGIIIAGLFTPTNQSHMIRSSSILRCGEGLTLSFTNNELMFKINGATSAVQCWVL